MTIAKAVVLGSLMLTSAITQARDGVEVCHIANAGFLIEGEAGAVLIDAVRLKPYKDYPVASEGLAAAIVQGKGRFADVDVALVTHYHADHFEAAATRAHLDNMPELEYVLSPQAAALVPGDKARLLEILPDWQGPSEKLEFGDISVEVFRVSHGRGRDIENNGYKVTVDGISFFHPGDIAADHEELAGAKVSGIDVDVYLGPFWYGAEGASRAALDKALSWKTMIPMHFQSGDPEWAESMGGMAAVRAEAYKAFKGAVKLEGEMACMTFDPSSFKD